jgi:hypothetical protein
MAYGFITPVEQAVITLIANNCEHRSGVRMQEAAWLQIFEHLEKELKEFRDALGNNDKPNQLEELGDIYGIFVHAVLKAGFSMAQVEKVELAKLKERFK